MHLVRDSISEFSPTGVVTSDGVNHEVDVILLATGFDILKAARPYDIIDKKGCNVQDVWGDTPRAHNGTTYPGILNGCT